MKPVVKKALPAAISVLRQATALVPKRKKASDGLLPSAAHIKANPNSDHNTGLAVDLTHDPKQVLTVPLFSRNLKKMSAFPILSSIRRFGRVSWLSLAIVSTVAVTLTLCIFIFLSMLIRLMTLALGFGG
jgi:hypothetical protein